MAIVKNIAIFCIQLILLIAIYQFGNLLAKYFRLEIPGNVLGMIILFVLLWLKIIKMNQIQLAANWLLKHFGFFFIPISVGLITLGPVLYHQGISILFVLSISGLLGIVTAGSVTQTLINKRDKENVKYYDHTI